MCGFVNPVTGYTKYPQLTRVHALYSLFMIRVFRVIRNEDRQTKLKAIGSEACEIKRSS